MTISEITNYTCVWDIDDNKGFIGFFNGEVFTAGHEYDDPLEFLVVMNLLRHEKPLYYDSENQWVSAGVRMTKPMFSADQPD